MIVITSLPLRLTGFETVFLTDAVGNGDIALGLPDKEAFVPLGRELLLLLGSAYLELVDVSGPTPVVKPEECTIFVNEEQAWLLRSKVQTSTLALNNTPIGAQLLTKLYDLLMQFNSWGSREFVMQFNSCFDDVHSIANTETDEKLDNVRKLMEEFNASSDKSTSTDTNGDTVPLS